MSTSSNMSSSATQESALEPQSGPRRKAAANADITIASNGIFRNQVFIEQFTWANGQVDFTTVDRYNSKTYNLVDDLKSMTFGARDECISSKTIELVIDTRSLLGKGITTIDQFDKPKPVHQYIHHLRTVIRVPYHSPFNLSKDSTQHKFLTKFVAVLRTLTNLENLDIIIVLPGQHKQWGYDWIMPFYDLETFTGWNLLIREDGKEVNVPAEDNDNMDVMWEEVKDRRRREESKNWQVISTIPSQEPVVQDAEESIGLANKKQMVKEKVAADKRAKEEADRKEKLEKKEKLKKKKV